MSAAIPSALGIVALAFTSGCPLLQVEAEIREVCLTYPDVQVEGVAGKTAIERSFVFDDLGGLQQLTALDAELEFVRAQISPKTGIAGLDFVRSARMTITSGDPESALPALTAYECDGDCVADGNLEIPSGARHDALKYVETGSILVDMKLEGQPPADAWTMDVDVCVAGRMAYTLDP